MGTFLEDAYVRDQEIIKLQKEWIAHLKLKAKIMTFVAMLYLVLFLISILFHVRAI